ncbi:hypothetical protein ACOMHN_057907 [Nucella lapillus]
MMKKMFDDQKETFEKKIHEAKDEIAKQISEVQGSVDTLCNEVEELKTRTSSMEETTVNLAMKNSEQVAALESLDERVENVKNALYDRIDKLEQFSRQDNLTFFNMIEPSDPENYDSCAETVINLLKKCVPDKEWSKSDITRAHRLGSSKNQARDSGSSRNRPRPMIVKFAHWGDKLHVLTKGKEVLKREGIAVAGDLTSRQQV